MEIYDSEVGSYELIFSEDIINNPLTFEQINSCRNVYFSNNPSKFKPHVLCDPPIH